jgi:protein SCO1
MPRIGIATVLGLLAGVAAALLAVSLQGRGTISPAIQSSPAGTSIGGPFLLTATDGKAVSSGDFQGKHLLVFFGFTNCPDICPSGLQQISAALDKLGPDAEAIVPLFITLDPERDTPEKIGSYLKSFHPRIIGLSGSADAVAAAAKAYRVYSKKVETGSQPADYSIDHSSFIYVMSREGKYIKHFRHNQDAGHLASGILEAIKSTP